MGLEVTGLNRLALVDVGLELKSGTVTAIVGRSGAGKTVLLRAIADLDPNDAQVSLDGASRESFSGPQWRRLVGYLATDAGWWEDIVGAHFADHAGAVETLSHLGLPDDIMKWPLSRTSTGERQRLALVRLLQARPRVMLLDEPTSALDHEATLVVEGLIADTVDEGTSVLLVTHDESQAKRVASRRLRLEEGRLTSEAS